MAATILDSAVLRGNFTTEAMRRVFSDEQRLQHYLDVEAALARVQARLGIIPQAAADEIQRHCSVHQLDLEKVRQETEAVGYPVLPVVKQLVARCVDDLGEYCHWGATTQDITDTATVLQMRDGLRIVEDELIAIAAALRELARRYRDTPMAGRSNLQQATPVTFGYKMAVLLSSVERHLDRLAELRPRALVGELGGATGTLASLGRSGLAVQAALVQELGLGQPTIAWHTARDSIAEVGCFLGLVTGTLGKLATDVKLLMQTEVEEAFEPYAHGRGASSTMPQKRNPVSSAYIHACAGIARQQVAALLDAMVADHERSTGPWQIEWVVLPELFLVSAGALHQARSMLEGLDVRPDRMRANLDLTQGLLGTEAVMMALGPRLGRQRAHDLLYDLSRESVTGGRPLLDILAETAEITQHLDRRALQALLDPARYVGLAGEMVDRVLDRSDRR